MKNVKLIVLTVSAILFLGMGNVNAQGNTVLIKGSMLSARASKITTVLPDAQVTESENDKRGEKEFLIALKQEIDKWLAEGYTISESTIGSSTPTLYSKFYTLTKKVE